MDKAVDNCRFCLGQKGGVLGNENRIGSVVICDYCTSLLMEAGIDFPQSPPTNAAQPRSMTNPYTE